ncbi:kinase-like domain-containing protein [Rhizophagus clarus]|uniref:Kinase-like domain-containing protein n=1 Tax=Rhizophagus clarus TaxID=94130 RepID=A0A8H3MEV0_9GLOM|nr:kinase-like domain-containing protein [Rhizophagus clarus]
MIVTLKYLNNPTNIILKFIKTAVSCKVCGITQDSKTKNYLVVLDIDNCKRCKIKCNTVYFQHNFDDWTSVSDFNKVYKARWIDGYIYKWDDNNQNWERHEQNMIVILKYLNNPTSSTLEFINKIALSCKVYGITQDSKTKNYMVVLNINKCEKCKIECNAMYFQHNFNIWTSGNNDIDKLIQSTQLSDHTTHDIFDALVWIPYNKLYNKNILESNFNKMYSVKWYDRCIYKWDDNDQNWKRKGQNVFVALKSLNNPASITLWNNSSQNLERKDQDMFVALKSLYNSKNITLEFINEITLHYKVNHYKCDIKLYGITQDPETENYIMVLDYAGNGNLRNYLDTSYNELSWTNRLNYLHSIAYGLKNIHDKELIHRDLHIEAGDIKKTLSQLFRESHDPDKYDVSNDSGIRKQIEEAERINNKLQIGSAFLTGLGISYETHSEAIYTSRLLNFDNLPQPKNSDDYYEVNDNIVSMKFSESLLINI